MSKSNSRVTLPDEEHHRKLLNFSMNKSLPPQNLGRRPNNEFAGSRKDLRHMEKLPAKFWTEALDDVDRLNLLNISSDLNRLKHQIAKNHQNTSLPNDRRPNMRVGRNYEPRENDEFYRTRMSTIPSRLPEGYESNPHVESTKQEAAGLSKTRSELFKALNETRLGLQDYELSMEESELDVTKNYQVRPEMLRIYRNLLNRSEPAGSTRLQNVPEDLVRPFNLYTGHLPDNFSNALRQQKHRQQNASMSYDYNSRKNKRLERNYNPDSNFIFPSRDTRMISSPLPNEQAFDDGSWSNFKTEKAAEDLGQSNFPSPSFEKFQIQEFDQMSLGPYEPVAERADIFAAKFDAGEANLSSESLSLVDDEFD